MIFKSIFQLLARQARAKKLGFEFQRPSGFQLPNSRVVWL